MSSRRAECLFSNSFVRIMLNREKVITFFLKEEGTDIVVFHTWCPVCFCCVCVFMCERMLGGTCSRCEEISVSRQRWIIVERWSFYWAVCFWLRSVISHLGVSRNTDILLLLCKNKTTTGFCNYCLYRLNIRISECCSACYSLPTKVV